MDLPHLHLGRLCVPLCGLALAAASLRCADAPHAAPPASPSAPPASPSSVQGSPPAQPPADPPAPPPAGPAASRPPSRSAIREDIRLILDPAQPDPVDSSAYVAAIARVRASPSAYVEITEHDYGSADSDFSPAPALPRLVELLLTDGSARSVSLATQIAGRYNVAANTAPEPGRAALRDRARTVNLLLARRRRPDSSAALVDTLPQDVCVESSPLGERWLVPTTCCCGEQSFCEARLASDGTVELHVQQDPATRTLCTAAVRTPTVCTLPTVANAFPLLVNGRSRTRADDWRPDASGESPGRCVTLALATFVLAPRPTDCDQRLAQRIGAGSTNPRGLNKLPRAAASAVLYARDAARRRDADTLRCIEPDEVGPSLVGPESVGRWDDESLQQLVRAIDGGCEMTDSETMYCPRRPAYGIHVAHFRRTADRWELYSFAFRPGV